MEPPGNTSSDILGIEIGRDVVRGVLLDSRSAEVQAVAESQVICDRRATVDGSVSVPSVAPAVTDLMYQLGIGHGSGIPVAVTMGPKHSGVGSGPALPGWLDEQAAWLEQPLLCSGNVGVSFAPAKAVQSVVALGLEVGLDPVRVELAVVAASRLLGNEVEDAVTLGSGRGWRARLRNFEVLEAMEVMEIGADEPLRIIRRDRMAGPITSFRNAAMAERLNINHPLDLSQLAPAVGAAVGARDDAPGNLLAGRTVACGPRAPQAAALAASGVALNEGVATDVGGYGNGRGRLTEADVAAAFRYDPTRDVVTAHVDGRTDTTKLRPTTRLTPLGHGNGERIGSTPQAPVDGGAQVAHSVPADWYAARQHSAPRPRPSPVAGGHRTTEIAPGAAVGVATSADPVQDRELIEMFRPDPDAVRQIRKAAGGRNLGMIFSTAIVLALAVAVLYTYL